MAAAGIGTASLCFAGADVGFGAGFRFTGTVAGFDTDFFVFLVTLAGLGAFLRTDGFAAVRLGAFPGAGFGRDARCEAGRGALLRTDGFGRGAFGRAGFRRDGAATLAALRTARRAGIGLERRVAGRVRFIAPSSGRGS